MQSTNKLFDSIDYNNIKLQPGDLTTKITLPNLSLDRPFGSSHHHFIKKRNYLEFLRQYQNKSNNFDYAEKEMANQIFSKNNNEYMDKKLFSNSRNSLIKKSQPKISPPANNLNRINEPNKIFMEEDFEINEKNNSIVKSEQKKSKNKLSASYILDEDPGFFSDLEDTKESSFSSLNFSFDYPEIGLDDSIRGKLITNAIELEKTFYRFYNMKNIPNKK